MQVCYSLCSLSCFSVCAPALLSFVEVEAVVVIVVARCVDADAAVVVAGAVVVVDAIMPPNDFEGGAFAAAAAHREWAEAVKLGLRVSREKPSALLLLC